MHFKNNLMLLASLAAAATAQTWSDCDPTKKTGCANNPAMPETFETDFTKGQTGVKGWKQTAGSLKYTADGAEFTVAKKGDSPTIQSETYLFFGYIEVKMKASAGQGIISSIVLESDDLDEIDWEFLGTDKQHVQMNYFGKGNTTVYDRMLEANVANPQDGFHTYALDWKSDSLTWIIDGTPVRTLKYGDANGGKNFPQTPSNVRIGIWAGGDPDNGKGVIDWAGGPTDYTKAPFTMTVASVKVKNYNVGTEYKWKDQSGDFKSIEVVGGENKNGSPSNTKVIESSAAATSGAGAPTGSGNGPAAGVIGGGVNVPVSTTAAGSKPTSTPTGDDEDDEPEETGAASTTCTDEAGKTTNTPKPTSIANATITHGADCSCKPVIVTVTEGYETPVTTPTASPTTFASIVYKNSTSAIQPPPSPPPVTYQAPPAPTPAYPTGGIMTDTASSPIITTPTIPTPSIPVKINTTSAPVSIFTGAAVPGAQYAPSGLMAVVLGAAGMLVL